MYTGMSCLDEASPVIDRGIALHKVLQYSCIRYTMRLWFLFIMWSTLYKTVDPFTDDSFLNDGIRRRGLP